MLDPFVEKLAFAWPVANWNDVSVLLAVSGGADSVAMLRAIHALKTSGTGRLIVAHVNHHLRTAADADAAFVRSLATELGLLCEQGDVQPSLESRCGDGLEAAARKARYKFLVATAARLGARYLATAHTADDQAETILHRILRGTGISGLAGIKRSRQVHPAVSLVRPMLGLRRQEVIAYLARLEQPYCIDETNVEWRFTRNRLRLDLLPKLQAEYNPAVVEALLRLGTLAGEAQEVLACVAESLVEASLIEATPGRLRVNCRALVDRPPYLVREALIALWRRQDWPEQSMGSNEWNELAGMVQASAKATDARTREFSGGILARTIAGELVLESPAATPLS